MAKGIFFTLAKLAKVNFALGGSQYVSPQHINITILTSISCRVIAALFYLYILNNLLYSYFLIFCFCICDSMTNYFFMNPINIIIFNSIYMSRNECISITLQIGTVFYVYNVNFRLK